jgi:hypothetical protein
MQTHGILHHQSFPEVDPPHLRTQTCTQNSTQTSTQNSTQTSTCSELYILTVQNSNGNRNGIPTLQVVTRLVPANALMAMNPPLSAHKLQLPDSTAKPVPMDSCLATRTPMATATIPMDTVIPTSKAVEFPADEGGFSIPENLELDGDSGSGNGSLLDTVMSPATAVG